MGSSGAVEAEIVLTAYTELNAIPTYGDGRRLAVDRREVRGRQTPNRVFLIVRNVVGRGGLVGRGAQVATTPGRGRKPLIATSVPVPARVGSEAVRELDGSVGVLCFRSTGPGCRAEPFKRSR